MLGLASPHAAAQRLYSDAIATRLGLHGSDASRPALPCSQYAEVVAEKEADDSFDNEDGHKASRPRPPPLLLLPTRDRRHRRALQTFLWPGAASAMPELALHARASAARATNSPSAAAYPCVVLQMFVDYLTRAYALFLAGEDDTSALEDEVSFVFNAKNAQLRQETESLRASNAQLDKQLQHLTGGETPLQKAESANRDLRADSAKFEAHIQQLQEHRAKLNDKLQAEEAERAAKASELASVAAEVEAHKAAIAKQELTPADVARMHAERSHLESELAKLKAHKEALSAQQWDQEVNVSKGKDRIHAKVAQANECLARLKDASGTVGGDAALAPAVQVSEGASGGAPYLERDPAATSKPPLLKLKGKLSERLLQLQDQLFEEETSATRALEERTRQRDKLAALQAGLTRLEREEGLMREAHAREVDELNRKAEAVHEKVHAGRSVLDTTLADAEGELASLRAEHDGFVSMAHRSREKMYNQVRRVMWHGPAGARALGGRPGVQQSDVSRPSIDRREPLRVPQA